MKFLALTDCPQGQQVGEIFEATEDAGHVLELVGAAKRVVEKPASDESQSTQPSQSSDAPKPPEETGAKRRQYKRADLTAQD